MRVLFIAPIPPPVNGHSIVSRVLLRGIELNNEVDLVNLSKASSKNINGHISLARIKEILGSYLKVLKSSRKAEVIYLTISESLAGNLKDLAFYIFAFGKLDKMYIHLHGGSIKRLLWDEHRILYKINKFFISKLGGVIISGESHRQVFCDMIDQSKIHIVRNFAGNDMFYNEEGINDKFSNRAPIDLLYLSSFHTDKGYGILLDAFLELNENQRSLYKLNFAGKFYDKNKETIFLEKIKGHKEIVYHGMVEDVTKTSLYQKAHVFILPTMYLEGQPISILDAYAAGCYVITTGLGGIPDIFQHDVHGYQIKEKSTVDMKNALLHLDTNFPKLKAQAIANFHDASDNYKKNHYTSSILEITKISK